MKDKENMRNIAEYRFIYFFSFIFIVSIQDK